MTDAAPRKIRVATAWLDGCSGCHMSLLDMDERLMALAPLLEVVYGPLVDLKAVPADIDLCLIEGAVSNEDDLHKVEQLRAASKFLIALGDCAVTGNVPSMRNPLPVAAVVDRAYRETAVRRDGDGPPVPSQGVPALLPKARPVHQIVHVDLCLQGCPPPAHAIHHVLAELLAGRHPDPTTVSRFGA